jgi:hypothetical protein
MAAAIFTTTFDALNPAHRTLGEWRRMSLYPADHVYVRPVTTAKRYARVHGEAKVLRADDSVVRYWLDEGKVRQRTYRSVVMVNHCQ